MISAIVYTVFQLRIYQYRDVLESNHHSLQLCLLLGGFLLLPDINLARLLLPLIPPFESLLHQVKNAGRTIAECKPQYSTPFPAITCFEKANRIVDQVGAVEFAPQVDAFPIGGNISRIVPASQSSHWYR